MNRTFNVYGKSISIGEKLSKYVEVLGELEESCADTISHFNENAKFFLEPKTQSIYVKSEIEQTIDRVLRNLVGSGYYMLSKEDMFEENPGYCSFLKAATHYYEYASLSKERQAVEMASQLQTARSETASQVTGLSFGILSSSLVAHLVYAAQNEAEVRRQTQEAQKTFDAVSSRIVEQSNKRVNADCEKYYSQVYAPTALQGIQQCFAYVLSQYIKALAEINEIELEDASKYDIARSSKILESLKYSEKKEDVIFAALNTCPYNIRVYQTAYSNRLLNRTLEDIAEYVGIDIGDLGSYKSEKQVKNEAIFAEAERMLLMNDIDFDDPHSNSRATSYFNSSRLLINKYPDSFVGYGMAAVFKIAVACFSSNKAIWGEVSNYLNSMFQYYNKEDDLADLWMNIAELFSTHTSAYCDSLQEAQNREDDLFDRSNFDAPESVQIRHYWELIPKYKSLYAQCLRPFKRMIEGFEKAGVPNQTSTSFLMFKSDLLYRVCKFCAPYDISFGNHDHWVRFQLPLSDRQFALNMYDELMKEGVDKYPHGLFYLNRDNRIYYENSAFGDIKGQIWRGDITYEGRASQGKFTEEDKKRGTKALAIFLDVFSLFLLGLDILLAMDKEYSVFLYIITCACIFFGFKVSRKVPKLSWIYVLSIVAVSAIVFHSIAAERCAVTGCLEKRYSSWGSNKSEYCYTHMAEEKDRIAANKIEKENAQKYDTALEYYSSGMYADSLALFLEIESFNDSSEWIDKCCAALYAVGEKKYQDGKFEEAIADFDELSSYQISTDWVDKINNEKKAIIYSQAFDHFNSSDFALAQQLFESLNDYEDSKEYAQICHDKNGQVVYENAESLLSSGDWFAAAKAFYSINNYQDAKIRCFEIWREHLPVNTISAENGGMDCFTFAVTNSGKVLATGKLNRGYGYADLSEVKDWTDIISIDENGGFAVGLKKDGTVVATGDNSTNQLSVSSWRNIVQISAGGFGSFGVCDDGTVKYTKYKYSNSQYSQFNYGQNDIGEWEDIVYISANSFHTVGLKADGTVVAVGRNGGGQCDVDDWTDIVFVEAGLAYTYGVKADGTVISTSNNSNMSVRGWKDIVAISDGEYHVVGLKKDGTVVASGSSVADNGELNVEKWNNIVAVAAGSKYTVALTKNGTLYAIGLNHVDGRLNANGWCNIKLPW